MFEVLGIFPQRLGKIGPHQPGCDCVDPDVVRAEFARQVLGHLDIGGLGDGIDPQDRRSAQPPDRRDQNDRARFARAHLGRDHRHQPVLGEDVVIKRLAERFVGDRAHRAIVGVRCGVADQHVDLAKGGTPGIDHRLQRFLGGEAGGYRNRCAGVLGIDRGRHVFARAQIAAGDHHLGAVIGEVLGNRLTDPARRSGDDGDLPGQVKLVHIPAFRAYSVALSISG